MSTRTVLVVANETLGGRELLLELEQMNEPRGSTRFHVLVPATRVDLSIKSGETDAQGRPIIDHRAQDLARHRLQAALTLLDAQGAEATGETGPADPFTAIARVLQRPNMYEEIILSTLPTGTSRWLRMDLPHRLQRKFDLPIRHIASAASEDLAEVVAAPLSIEHHDLPEEADRFDRPVQVVLVEDTATDAQLTAIALERSDLDVELRVCPGAHEALALLTGSDPHPADLILLDLRMPEMDGLELLEILGRSLDLDTVPVVILTTSDLDEDRERSHELGAHAYVVKDPDFLRFQEVLEGIIVEQAVTISARV